MKKLMVLSLVLAIGAVSSAALTIEVDGLTATIKSDVALFGGVDFGMGVLGDPGTALFGDVSTIQDGVRPTDPIGYTYLGDAMFGAGLPWGEAAFVIWQSPATDAFPAGNWISVSFTGAEAPFEFQIFDASTFDIIASASVVPEPMTMGLLGLGALFLRRRK